MKISDERLEELAQLYAERASLETTGLKEMIDVAAALRELQERRATEQL